MKLNPRIEHKGPGYWGLFDRFEPTAKPRLGRLGLFTVNAAHNMTRLSSDKPEGNKPTLGLIGVTPDKIKFAAQRRAVQVAEWALQEPDYGEVDPEERDRKGGHLWWWQAPPDTDDEVEA